MMQENHSILLLGGKFSINTQTFSKFYLSKKYELIEYYVSVIR
jgi:hypothetical protein